MRYMWFSAFAICGIAFYVWLETYAQAHRQAMERLLEESKKSRVEVEAEQVGKTAWDNGTRTDSPPHTTYT